MAYLPSYIDLTLLEPVVPDLTPARSQLLRGAEAHQRSLAYGWGSPPVVIDVVATTASPIVVPCAIPPGCTAVRVGVRCGVGFARVTLTTPWGSTSGLVSSSEQISWLPDVLELDEGYRWQWRSTEMTIEGDLGTCLVDSVLLQPVLVARGGTARDWTPSAWLMTGEPPIECDGLARSYDALGFWLSAWIDGTGDLLTFGSSADLSALVVAVTGSAVTLTIEDDTATEIGSASWTVATSGWTHLLIYIVPSDCTGCLLWVDGASEGAPDSSTGGGDIVVDEARVGGLAGYLGDLALYGREVTPSSSAHYAGGSWIDWRLLASCSGLREYICPGAGDAVIGPWTLTGRVTPGDAIVFPLPLPPWLTGYLDCNGTVWALASGAMTGIAAPWTRVVVWQMGTTGPAPAAGGPDLDIYSDDGGANWYIGDPFVASAAGAGSGERVVVSATNDTTGVLRVVSAAADATGSGAMTPSSSADLWVAKSQIYSPSADTRIYADLVLTGAAPTVSELRALLTTPPWEVFDPSTILRCYIPAMAYQSGADVIIPDVAQYIGGPRAPVNAVMQDGDLADIEIP